MCQWGYGYYLQNCKLPWPKRHMDPMSENTTQRVAPCRIYLDAGICTKKDKRIPLVALADDCRWCNYPNLYKSFDKDNWIFETQNRQVSQDVTNMLQFGLSGNFQSSQQTNTVAYDSADSRKGKTSYKMRGASGDKAKQPYHMQEGSGTGGLASYTLKQPSSGQQDKGNDTIVGPYGAASPASYTSYPSSSGQQNEGYDPGVEPSGTADSASYTSYPSSSGQLYGSYDAGAGPSESMGGSAESQQYIDPRLLEHQNSLTQEDVGYQATYGMDYVTSTDYLPYQNLMITSPDSGAANQPDQMQARDDSSRNLPYRAQVGKGSGRGDGGSGRQEAALHETGRIAEAEQPHAARHRKGKEADRAEGGSGCSSKRAQPRSSTRSKGKSGKDHERGKSNGGGKGRRKG